MTWRRFKYPLLILGASLGLFVGTQFGPATIVYYDLLGYPEELLQYRHDLAFFIQGASVCLLTLIASRIVKVGMSSVLLTSLFAFFIYHLFIIVDNSVMFTRFTFFSFGRALPGFFVGMYFVIGIWFSIAQYVDRNSRKGST